MIYPQRFSNLPAYAFPRLRALLDQYPAGGEVVHMTIGEPRHEFPDFVTREIAAHAALFGQYPKNEGYPELRRAITRWVDRRYGVALDADRHVMVLNGTREGLYNAPMALCPETKHGQRPVILCPNPFYQAYMVAGISVGAEPVFVDATVETGHLPDYANLPAEVLNRTAIAYICSPANPQGAVADRSYWQTLIGLAEQYDFRIIADECYSEIYRDVAPVGALQVAQEMGANPARVVVFHSLSKRSNLPGLRCGFAACRDEETMTAMRQLRNYSGAPVAGPLQMAAAAVWDDETHVEENRRLYREKFSIADDILGDVPGYSSPEAGFFLWLPVPATMPVPETLPMPATMPGPETVSDGEAAALKVWRETGVRVLPGAYLAQGKGDSNPGNRFIRVAMVAPKDEFANGLTRLRDCLYT
jgi:aspartate/methionine/tyrosine aminotransferase